MRHIVDRNITDTSRRPTAIKVGHGEWEIEPTTYRIDRPPTCTSKFNANKLRIQSEINTAQRGKAGKWESGKAGKRESQEEEQLNWVAQP